MIGYHTLKTNEQDSYAPQELTRAGFVDLSSNRKALKMTCYVLRTGKEEPQLVKLNRPVLKVSSQFLTGKSTKINMFPLSIRENTNKPYKIKKK